MVLWGQGDFSGKGLDFSHPSSVTAHQSPLPEWGVATSPFQEATLSPSGICKGLLG